MWNELEMFSKREFNTVASLVRTMILKELDFRMRRGKDGEVKEKEKKKQKRKKGGEEEEEKSEKLLSVVDQIKGLIIGFSIDTVDKIAELRNLPKETVYNGFVELFSLNGVKVLDVLRTTPIRVKTIEEIVSLSELSIDQVKDGLKRIEARETSVWPSGRGFLPPNLVALLNK